MTDIKKLIGLMSTFCLVLTLVFIPITANAQPVKSNLIAEQIETAAYLAKVLDVNNHIEDSLHQVQFLCTIYDGSVYWKGAMKNLLYDIEYQVTVAKNVTPPQKYQMMHYYWIKAMDELQNFNVSMLTGMDNDEANFYDDAKMHLDQANAYFNRATAENNRII